MLQVTRTQVLMAGGPGDSEEQRETPRFAENVFPATNPASSLSAGQHCSKLAQAPAMKHLVPVLEVEGTSASKFLH